MNTESNTARNFDAERLAFAQARRERRAKMREAARIATLTLLGRLPKKAPARKRVTKPKTKKVEVV